MSQVQETFEEVVIGEDDNFTDQDEEETKSKTHKQEYIELKNIFTETQISAKNVAGNALRPGRQVSQLWNNFTIVSPKYRVATCNICDLKLSYKATTTNLKKHLLRKHPNYCDKSSVASFQGTLEEVVLGEDEDFSEDKEESKSITHKQKFVELKNIFTETQISTKNVAGNALRKGRQVSKLWNNFTIVSKEHRVATCNICGLKLSYRATTTNLKTHLVRKHPKYSDSSSVASFQEKYKTTPNKRPRLSELGGIDSFILNVVAEEGADVEIVGHEVEPNELPEVNGQTHFGGDEGRIAHNETSTPRIVSISGARENSVSETKYSSSPRVSKISERIEKMKNNRIIDLQLECLELKKYNMQMESLVLERELNLPRSIYTENLKGCDNVTRSTQTDVGGGNTKVFYITDYQDHDAQGTRHLFSFQAVPD